jgi:hypothetical protein
MINLDAKIVISRCTHSNFKTGDCHQTIMIDIRRNDGIKESIELSLEDFALIVTGQVTDCKLIIS